MVAMTFDEYLNAHRGAAAEIARALKINHAAVRQWKERGVPAERVLEVERLTGLSRHALRPDVFGPYPTVPPVQQAAWDGSDRRGQMQ